EEARPRRIGRTTDGMIWYGDWTAGMLGRLNPESGEVKEWQLPGGERARPYAMGVDSRDRVWVFQTGIQPNTLVGFDQNTEAFLSETAVPSGGRTVRHMHFHAPTNSFWFGADTGTIGQVILP
ncbi:MAG: lyase, partial [Gemmatimonadota bacterium]